MTKTGVGLWTLLRMIIEDIRFPHISSIILSVYNGISKSFSCMILSWDAFFPTKQFVVYKTKDRKSNKHKQQHISLGTAGRLENRTTHWDTVLKARRHNAQFDVWAIAINSAWYHTKW